MRSLSSTIFCAVLALTANAQLTLIDQTPGQLGTAVVSQVFESSLANFNSTAADDFTVASGEQWHIDSVLLFGQYASPTSPVPGAGMFLSIYSDAGGLPGTLQFSDTIQSGADPQNDGSLKFSLSEPIVLSSGTYWLVAGARKDAGSSLTQWEWFRSTTSSQDSAIWQNPGGGYSLVNCPTWSAINDCYGGTATGLSFIIYGCPTTKPTISGLPSDTSYCSADGLELVINTNASSPSYLWSTGDTTNSTSAMGTGDLWVVVSDQNTGCVSSDTISIIENPTPVVSLEDDSICQGEVATLSVSPCGSCTVEWSTGETTNSIQVEDEGNYWVIVEDVTSGCDGSDTAYVAVLDTPQVVFNVADSFARCSNDTLVLETTEQYTAYNWSSGSSSSAIQVTQTGVYGLTATDANGCVGSRQIFIDEVPSPDPEISVSFNGGLFTLSLTENYQTYAWSNGSSDPTITVAGGFYQVTVTNEFGCSAIASADIPLGSKEFDSKTDVSVYPIPASDYLNVESFLNKDFEYTMYNLQGQRMLEGKGRDGIEQISLSDLARGGYLLSISSGSKTFIYYIPKL